MKLIAKENIDELIHLDDELLGYNVNCFQYEPNKGSYKFYIFTCDFDSEKELVEKYSLINQVIAFDFQRTLLSDIEKWNLYLFYFVNHKLSEEVKFLVEQDKYGTRKLVFDNTKIELTVEQKKELISNKLFNLNLNKNRIDNSETTETLKDFIEHEDPLLLKTIISFKEIKLKNQKAIKEKKAEMVKAYLEMKTNE